MTQNGYCMIIITLMPMFTLAVEPLEYQTDNGIEIIPSIKVDTGYNDNVLHTTNNTVNSSTLTMTPKVIVQLDTDRGIYQFDYRLDSTNYIDSSEDNYVEHKMHVGAFWMFNIRNRLRINYKFRNASEARGTGLTEGISLAINEPLRFHHQDLITRYTYGAAGSKGRLVTVLGYESKNYINTSFIRSSVLNETPQIEETRYYDWTQPYVSGEFYYAVSSSFHAVIMGRYEDRNYESIDPVPGISRDNNNTLFYTGLEWLITGKTTGELLIGLQNKDFTDSRRKNFQGLSWRIKMNWHPTDFSEFRIETRDYARDPDINADYVKDRSLRLDWEHDWTPFFSTLISARYGINKYPANIRKDKDTLYEIAVTYSLARYWDAFIGISTFDRNSTLTGVSYNQTRLFLGMEVSL